jgi:hypothetical protein
MPAAALQEQARQMAALVVAVREVLVAARPRLRAVLVEQD